MQDWAASRAFYEGTLDADLEASVLAARDAPQATRGQDMIISRVFHEGTLCADLEAAISTAREKAKMPLYSPVLAPSWNNREEGYKQLGAPQAMRVQDWSASRAFYEGTSDADLEASVLAAREKARCSIAEAAKGKLPINRMAASTADTLPSVGDSGASESDEAGSD